MQYISKKREKNKKFDFKKDINKKSRILYNEDLTNLKYNVK